MTPEDLISSIRREVLEANLTMYKQDLERVAGTTHWPQLRVLYQSLTDEQQFQFMSGIRQIMVDTISNVLGILDGSTLLEKHRSYFRLTYDDKPQELTGELQDLFLSRESR